MKRNKNEIRNIGLTLIIMAFVVVAMFAIVHMIRIICDEEIANSTHNEIGQELSEEDLNIRS